MAESVEMDPAAMDTSKVVLRPKRTRTGRMRDSQNGGSRPKSEFFSPSGISTLDIRTRLRITEAELALVQREVSDLLVERNSLENSSRQFEESWKFAVKECGRVVEQRDELQKRLEMLQQLIATGPQTPEKGKTKGRGGRGSIDHLKLQLETQTRVAESFEHERDKAYDDYELAQAQISTLMKQYQELASSCSEVAREKDKYKAEVQVLREELHRYDPEESITSARNSLRKVDSLISGSHGSLASLGGGVTDEDGGGLLSDPTVLVQHIKEMKQERDKANTKKDQALKRAEQFQKQLYRAEEDRRQALATSEALTALWQKKFEKAQNENYDLRQELLTAQERNSLLLERLAMARVQSRDPTPLRGSPPDAEGTHSPTKFYYGYNREGSYSSYSLSQTTPSATPSTLLPASSMSQSSTSTSISGMTGIGRHGSVTGSRDNLPLQYPPSPHKKYHYEEDYEESHDTDDESSWI